MNKKSVLFTIGIIAVLAIVGTIGYYKAKYTTTNKAGTWECVDGEWIKRGNPSSDKPTMACPAHNGSTTTPPVGGNNGGTTTPGSGGSTTTPEANIVVYSPRANDRVGSTFTVTGKARVFENTFQVRAKKGAKKLYEHYAMTNAMEMGEYGYFEHQVALGDAVSEGDAIVLEVFEYSARDGSEINKVIVPLRIARPVGDLSGAPETMTVKAFFSNYTYDPAVTCNKVFSVTRIVPKTKAVAAAAIQELLEGPTAMEGKLGYRTNIPSDAKLNKVEIRNGVAYADFNNDLQEGVGGSCRVGAIVAQITETLKQFPSVTSVVISVNGNSDEILQP